jgi:hypothetical protein
MFNTNKMNAKCKKIFGRETKGKMSVWAHRRKERYNSEIVLE